MYHTFLSVSIKKQPFLSTGLIIERKPEKGKPIFWTKILWKVFTSLQNF